MIDPQPPFTALERRLLAVGCGALLVVVGCAVGLLSWALQFSERLR
jgi:hypothetical protein